MEFMSLGKLVKRRYEELIGKSREAYAGEVLKLAPMMQELVRFTDRDWCMYAFSRERLKDLIAPEQRQIFSAEAMQCGRSYAQEIKQTFGTDLDAIAEKYGLQVNYLFNPERFRRGETARFASFEAPNKVTIYSDCVEKANETYEAEGLRSIMGEVNFRDVLLAHEIFHFLEERDKDTIYTLQTKVQVTKNNIIKKFSSIFVLSEIAGMAFASELLDLPYCTYAMDCLLSYMYSPQAASDLFRMTMRITHKTANAYVDAPRLN